MKFDSVDLDVFVFPLPRVTLFPSTVKVLNIFEPRYLEMVNDAIAQDKPIAVCSRASVGFISGCGRLQILQERDDGTKLILVRADCKIQLTSLDDLSKPYILAKASSVVEHSELEDGNRFYLHRVMKELEGWLERNIPAPKRREEFLSQIGTDEERVNTACDLLIEDSDWQQRLLEIDDLNERLKTVASLFETSAASH